MAAEVNAVMEDKGNGCWQLAGELDFVSVPALLSGSRMEYSTGREISVDLAGVTRADSAGLALLVEWLRESECRGGTIRFENVPVQLLSMARVCGLDRILPLD